MRDWANLDDLQIQAPAQRSNLAVLRAELRSRENILAVAASVRPNSFWRPGVLAVTETRVVFVAARLRRRRGPFVVSLPFDRILTAEMSTKPVTGTITLGTIDGVLVFRHVSPKERTWPIYWRISERIGQLPLGRHSRTLIWSAACQPGRGSRPRCLRGSGSAGGAHRLSSTSVSRLICAGWCRMTGYAK